MQQLSDQVGTSTNYCVLIIAVNNTRCAKKFLDIESIFASLALFAAEY